MQTVEPEMVVREKRHLRFMEMIHAYAPTPEQTVYLEAVKHNTQLEIAFRFGNSLMNRSYVFPRGQERGCEEEGEEEGEDEISPSRQFDLYTQDYLPLPIFQLQIERKPPTRRVKSLGSEEAKPQRPQQRGGKRGRLELPSIKSHRVTCKTEEIQGLVISQGILPKRNLVARKSERARQNSGGLLKKVLEERQFLGAKLLTEQQQVVRFRSGKVAGNLKRFSPRKKAA